MWKSRLPTLTHLDLLLDSTLLWGIPLDLAILLRQIKTHQELGGTPITPQTGNINKPPSYVIFTIFNNGAMSENVSARFYDSDLR